MFVPLMKCDAANVRVDARVCLVSESPSSTSDLPTTTESATPEMTTELDTTGE